MSNVSDRRTWKLHGVIPAAMILLMILLFVGVCPVLGGQPHVEKPSESPTQQKASSGKKADSKSESEAPKEKDEPKPPDRYFAIVNAHVHTITRGDHDRATVLAKNGKIQRIGANVTLPKETEIVDAKGMHVYPGWIAAASGNVLGSGKPEDTTDVYGLNMTLALAGGVTTMIAGETAAKLTFGSTEEMIVQRDLFEKIRYSFRSPNQRRKVREGLERVRQYQRDLEAHKERKKSDPEDKPPVKDWLKGEYLTYQKLLRGEAVVYVRANRAYELLEICDLARQFGLRVVVVGAAEGWTVPTEMASAGVSAIVTPRTRLDREEEYNRPTGSSIENAAILQRHGIPIAIVPTNSAITTWGLAGQDLLHLNLEAAFAVRGGLSNEAALHAITIGAARVLGIDHRVGSLEVGKDADMIVIDGDPLHYMTLVHWTIVNGRVVYDKDKESLFNHIRPQGSADPSVSEDPWPRRWVKWEGNAP